jgi:hypothetical protein
MRVLASTGTSGAPYSTHSAQPWHRHLAVVPCTTGNAVSALRGFTRGERESRGVAHASLLPVGSAKFGPLVGGVVSPTLVGTRVGAAGTALEPCAGRSEHCCEYTLSTLKCRTASYP